jgi:GTP-binding protein HflX
LPPNRPIPTLGPFRKSARTSALGGPIQIFGNTHGLKASQVKSIERLNKRRLPADRLVTNDFARQLTEISRDIRREVGVLIDRRGDVTHVMVGDAGSIEMPEWGRIRAGRGRLRGFRCVHTHLSGEGLTRDDLTDLLLLRLDAMVTLEVLEDGLPGLAHTAALKPNDGDSSGETGDGFERGIEKLDPVHPAQLDLDFTGWIRDLENDLARSVTVQQVGDGERALLVSVTAGRSRDEFEAHVEELSELARSAGVELVEVITQQRRRVDPKTVVGSGKLQDLMIRSFQSDVDLVVFDQDLTPTQARNLSERMELRVIDRTQLILDIFAQRATSRDGKLQVELAQLKYRMPRLAQRADVSLSRLEGRIGGRGPGESKLETDQRRVRDRVARLEKELGKLSSQRKNRRRRRERRDVPVLSIVGYTNAGKSTLLRALTESDVHIEDKMFATLDPVSRRLRFPREREVIITDTVGFIRDLPQELVAAFQATLEELSDASLLMHVVDASSPDLERRMNAVRKILDDLGLTDAPELLVFNKADQLPPGEAEAIAERLGGVAVSAISRAGLANLLTNAEKLLFSHDELAGVAKRAEDLAAAGG